MFAETIQAFFLRLKDDFVNFKPFPAILDILLVAVLIYAVSLQLRKTKSIQVLKGILLIAVVYGLVTTLGMSASTWIFNQLFGNIIIIFVVLFSDELRHALERVGKGGFRKGLPFLRQDREAASVDAINAVARACGAMSRNHVGSLILFQRNTLLGDLMKQAVHIDSETTFEMLCSIFYPKAPLHDGAVIINEGRIMAARCVVPMKNDRELSSGLGTRHRAALEASLNSDCVAVVTSEESGVISVAVEGRLMRGMTDSELRELLGKYLLGGGDRVKKNGGKKEKPAPELSEKTEPAPKKAAAPVPKPEEKPAPKPGPEPEPAAQAEPAEPQGEEASENG